MHPPSAGKFFESESLRGGPALLLLHGSEGERRDKLAARFAVAGISTLAIKYFGANGCPASLVEVPLEIVEGAATWLADTTGCPVAVAGHSKGAELSLLAASILPFSFAGVIGWAPSCVAWYSLDHGGPRGYERSSWAHARTPVPFVPYLTSAMPGRSPRGTVLRPCYEVALDTLDSDVARAAISIERGCVALLVSGRDDELWPSTRMAESLVRRARERGGAEVQHIAYDGVGHMITPDHAGATGHGQIDFGGEPERDVRAAEDAFDRCLAFLRAL